MKLPNGAYYNEGAVVLNASQPFIGCPKLAISDFFPKAL